MVPAAAMSHTNQRMCAARGPNSRRFNLSETRTENGIDISLHLRHRPLWVHAVLCPTLTKVCRRQRWRSRWPLCHTCGNTVPQTWNKQQVKSCFSHSRDIICTFLQVNPLIHSKLYHVSTVEVVIQVEAAAVALHYISGLQQHDMNASTLYSLKWLC